MRIYIAASFPNKDKAQALREYLREKGHVITSRWLDGHNAMYGMQPQFALMDAEDVASAEVLVCMTGDTLTRGGRHAEVGMAIALRKPIILYCEDFAEKAREMVFHHHPLCESACMRLDLIGLLQFWEVAKGNGSWEHEIDRLCRPAASTKSSETDTSVAKS